MVLESIYVLPRRKPASAPSAPHKIPSTAGGSLTIVISTSTWDAVSRGFAPNFAPSLTSSSARSFVRFQRSKGNPALSRFPPIGFPINPNPINPTVGFISPPPGTHAIYAWLDAESSRKVWKSPASGKLHKKLTPGFNGLGVNHGGHLGTLRSLGKPYHVFVRNLHTHSLLSFSLQYSLFNHNRSPRVGHERPHGFLVDVRHPILGFHPLSHQ